MKILHVTPSYFPATRYGGPIYSVHGLCKSLAALGHHVDVCSTPVDGDADSAVPLNQPVDLDGVQVTYFPSRRLRRIYYAPGMGRHLKSAASTYDFIHLHSVFLWPTWAGARAACQNGVPYAVSPRGMLVRDLIERRSRLAKLAWIRLIEQRNLKGAAFIHTTSDTETLALGDLGLDLAPNHQIPNGVDPPLSWEPGDVSDDIGRTLEFGPQLIYLGRISWEKGLDRLIRSLDLVSDVKAVIAGNDEENHASTLRRLIAQLDLEDRVLILDRRVEGADKEALFQAAPVVVLPSLSENFGNVVLEAMIRGRAVIVSRDVGAAPIVEKAGAGLVFDGLPEDLAQAIRALIENPARRAHMAAAGQREAEENYQWSAIAAQMEKCYAKYIGRKPPG